MVDNISTMSSHSSLSMNQKTRMALEKTGISHWTNLPLQSTSRWTILSATIVNLCLGTTQPYLRTVSHELCSTFRNVCVALQLIDNDQEWVEFFQETKFYAGGSSLRDLFVTALLMDAITEPTEIWIQFWDDFFDNLNRWLKRQGLLNTVPSNFVDPHYDYGLFLLSQLLALQNQFLFDVWLPSYIHNWSPAHNNVLIASELRYNTDNEQTAFKCEAQQANKGQQRFFNAVLGHVGQTPTQARFFFRVRLEQAKRFVIGVCVTTTEGKIILYFVLRPLE